MINEIIVSAATLLVSGNVISAAAWARERVKSKMSASLRSDLDKTLQDYDDLIELNDKLLYEKFQEMGPAITAFLKKNPGLIPFSALSGVEFTREQMEEWISQNEGKISDSFVQSLFKRMTKEHSWKEISKNGNLSFPDRRSITLTLINEKCEKCNLIHRYTVPLVSPDDGFFRGGKRVNGEAFCTH